jgi:hypothetical protein
MGPTVWVAVMDSPMWTSRVSTMSSKPNSGVLVPTTAAPANTRTRACGTNPDTCTMRAQSWMGDPTMGGERLSRSRMGNWSLRRGRSCARREAGTMTASRIASRNR